MNVELLKPTMQLPLGFNRDLLTSELNQMISGPCSCGSNPTVFGFSLGSTVVIQGVLAKPELNSQTGTVLGAQGAERVQVRLASGVGVALKPTNLREWSESGL